MAEVVGACVAVGESIDAVFGKFFFHEREGGGVAQPTGDMHGFGPAFREPLVFVYAEVEF